MADEPDLITKYRIGAFKITDLKLRHIFCVIYARNNFPILIYVKFSNFDLKI